MSGIICRTGCALWIMTGNKKLLKKGCFAASWLNAMLQYIGAFIQCGLWSRWRRSRKDFWMLCWLIPLLIGAWLSLLPSLVLFSVRILFHLHAILLFSISLSNSRHQFWSRWCFRREGMSLWCDCGRSICSTEGRHQGHQVSFSLHRAGRLHLVFGLATIPLQKVTQNIMESQWSCSI